MSGGGVTWSVEDRTRRGTCEGMSLNPVNPGGVSTGPSRRVGGSRDDLRNERVVMGVRRESDDDPKITYLPPSSLSTLRLGPPVVFDLLPSSLRPTPPHRSTKRERRNVGPLFKVDLPFLSSRRPVSRGG